MPSDKYYFYYGPNSIEITENYKYLGVIFNYIGRFQLAAPSLADKAKQAYFALESKLYFSNDISVKSWLTMHNSMIIPIMTYGSKIWITDFKLKFETLDKSPFEKT